MKKDFAPAVVYLIVFLTGAAVMVIELLGTRLIAPFYGASLYVWSSLISVTLLALATGYFAGGRWADRAQRGGLALIISLAGLTTLMMIWATRWVLLATDPLGLRAGAFVSALLLFFPSLALLGMVGPFAVKLATDRLASIGTGTGTIYAVSTFGSVVGTLMLGFFLFPLFGTWEILMGTSAILVSLGVAVGCYENRLSPGPAGMFPLAMVGLMGAGLFLALMVDAHPGLKNANGYQVVSERESLYGWVRVIDNPARDMRLLTADASVIGAASISAGENLLAYQDIVGLIPSLAPGIHRALLIGQGAGHMAMTLRDRHGIVTDTLEIDPAVADAATRYFGFSATGQAKIGDGRYEIRQLKGPYDLIIHDCFTGGAEPTHLLTVETLIQLRELLSANGILALNFVAFNEPGQNDALASVGKTLAQVFPNYSLFASEPGKSFNDFIFLASRQRFSAGTGNLNPEARMWLNQRKISLDDSAGTVLTDNFNPLEHLQVRKSERYRALLVEWLGHELLVR